MYPEISFKDKAVIPMRINDIAKLLELAEPKPDQKAARPNEIGYEQNVRSFRIWTNYDTVVVSDGDKYGIAVTGDEEQFDLRKGTCVALLRLIIDPQEETDCVQCFCRKYPGYWQAETSLMELGRIAGVVGCEVGASVEKNKYANLWRSLDKHANFPVVIIGHNLN